MIFKDIQLVIEGKYRNNAEEQHLLLKELERNRYLMHCWENLRDQFCLNLPNNFDLNGISKLNIKFGVFEKELYQAPGKNGIAVFQRSDFNFEKFTQLTDKEKDLISLYYMEDSLLKVCRTLNLPNNTLEEILLITESIKQQKFEFFKLHKKTSKSNASRSLKAVTTLHFKKGGVDADIEILDKSGKTVFGEKIIECRYWESVWFDLWKGHWHKNVFIIENRIGTQFYQAPDLSNNAT